MVALDEATVQTPAGSLGGAGRGLCHGLHDQGLPGVAAAGADCRAVHALAAPPWVMLRYGPLAIGVRC